jgi:TPP-dependent pyruvate/acetoin dehydrogenase alpha subunit
MVVYAYSQKNTVSMVVTESGQIPVGAGLAFADKYFETGGVTMTYFGAARQGSLHEASTWQCCGNYQ